MCVLGFVSLTFQIIYNVLYVIPNPRNGSLQMGNLKGMGTKEQFD